MQIIVHSPTPDRRTSFRVTLRQAHQSFDFGYRSTFEDCVWYAEMFKQAMKANEAAGSTVVLLCYPDEPANI